MAEPSMICPYCKEERENPVDVQNEYCSNCGCFWGDLKQFLALAKAGRIWKKVTGNEPVMKPGKG